MMLLPYSYNVRKRVYHPMRLFHFCGPASLGYKPWTNSRSKQDSRDAPINTRDDLHSAWWHYFYEAVGAYNLTSWMERRAIAP